MPEWLIAFTPSLDFIGIAVVVLAPLAAVLYLSLAVLFLRGRARTIGIAGFLAGPPLALTAGLLLDLDLSVPFLFYMIAAAATVALERALRRGPEFAGAAVLPALIVVLWYFFWLAAEASNAV